ncbi:TatD family hydrolase [Priestia abyssalis]|uniref:TatD family hydrolase n=1 Tax=Priestia abyssalis TaxID=1221450 RepID=UPI0009958CA5|nr:TatD family hydrolase [Priestia abyssalis]
MIDAHIHLDQYDDIDLKIEQWQAAGVTGVVAVSTDLNSSYDTLALKQKYPDFIWAAIGFHPEQPLPPDQDVAEWHSLLYQERRLISAVGEVGLPYYTPHTSNMEQYIELLDNMMITAKKENLPIVLHAVHSGAPVAYKLLVKNRIKKAHFHWLKAPASIVEQITTSGYYISVTPEVCYRERDEILVNHIPLDKLLIETDGPWPFSGPFEQMETTPLLLKDATKKVASLKGIALKETIEALTANTLSLYASEQKIPSMFK